MSDNMKAVMMGLAVIGMLFGVMMPVAWILAVTCVAAALSAFVARKFFKEAPFGPPESLGAIFQLFLVVLIFLAPAWIAWLIKTHLR
jgi:uncharacterized membrane protein (DUF373 family)